ncbi:Serine/threonine-protein kinase/endoribonuclease ire-1 [Orchesella cincta]|uniref:Serine/threonine-protein kinase/endoribonuclease ire-1 n=1 Tax=Orchesella cincta TaxID=48709 RepID=A0A1D2M583_ORCCI|nr:Serine/threonine-protein kinase/endoribonuclease ire-1 [Orchesella cincta]
MKFPCKYIRYFDQELHTDFILIALELCDMSLAMWMQDKCKRQLAKICHREILMQCSKGLAYLHEKKIIHRDIKPENILIVVDTTNGKVCVKISDFGLCKQLPVEKTSFTLTSHSGSYGWQAPEVLRFVAKNQAETLLKNEL